MNALQATPPTFSPPPPATMVKPPVILASDKPPAQPEMASPPHRPDPTTRHGGPDRAARQDLRLLLLEDDEGNAQVMEGFLDALGYGVPDLVCSLSAFEKALPRILAGDYDLVIMDIMLPDGDSSSDAVGRVTKESSVPCIAYTSRVWPEERSHLVRSGFSAVLSKPLSLAALDGHLKRILC